MKKTAYFIVGLCILVIVLLEFAYLLQMASVVVGESLIYPPSQPAFNLILSETWISLVAAFAIGVFLVIYSRKQ